jgi:predicted transcriptional regulator
MPPDADALFHHSLTPDRLRRWAALHAAAARILEEMAEARGRGDANAVASCLTRLADLSAKQEKGHGISVLKPPQA